jgi:hypothetical protein
LPDEDSNTHHDDTEIDGKHCVIFEERLVETAIFLREGGGNISPIGLT